MFEIKKGDLFLCDSGGQYTGATTDVTRTIFMGAVKPKREFVNMYTRVLIGHLNIGMLKFQRVQKVIKLTFLQDVICGKRVLILIMELDTVLVVF